VSRPCETHTTRTACRGSGLATAWSVSGAEDDDAADDDAAADGAGGGVAGGRGVRLGRALGGGDVGGFAFFSAGIEPLFAVGGIRLGIAPELDDMPDADAEPVP